MLKNTRRPIHDRGKFEVLVNDLRQCKDNLEYVTDTPVLQRRQLLILDQEIRSLGNDSIFLFGKRRGESLQDWSDAATNILDRSVMETKTEEASSTG